MKRPVLLPGERLELVDYASGPLYRIDVVGEDGTHRTVGWGPYMGGAPQWWRYVSLHANPAWPAVHARAGGAAYLTAMRVAFYQQHGWWRTTRTPNPVEVFGATAVCE